MINQELLIEISKIQDPRNPSINISPEKCLELAIAVKRGGYKSQVKTMFIGGQCQCIARLQILSGMDDCDFANQLMEGASK